MLRALFGGSKCRTIDKLDILGDGSCIELYRFDGNANGVSGSFHGSEGGAIAYGGGKFERGIVLNGTSGYIDIPSILTTNSCAFSFWITKNGTWVTDNEIADFRKNKNIEIFAVSTGAIKIGVNDGAWKYAQSTSLITTDAKHVVFSIESGVEVKCYVDNVLESTTPIGTPTNGIEAYNTLGANSVRVPTRFTNCTIDQFRIFNKKLVASEVAICFNECAPTSILADINPFLDNSLKALFPFNGNANDLTGAYNGTPSNITYGTGKFGLCAVFNGSTSKVVFSGAMPSGDITVSALIKLNSLATTQSIIFLGNPRQIQWYVTTNGLMHVTNGTLDAVSSTALVIGVWYLVSYTITNGVSQIWINAIKNGSSSTQTFTATTNLNSIGYEEPFSRYSLNGSLEHGYIFNKALTPIELASVYCQTTPLEEPLYALVDPFRDFRGKALWRFEGNALDESGNFNGTASNITWSVGAVGRYASFNGSTSGITTANFAGYKALTVRAKKTASGLQYALVGGSDDSWFGFSDASDSNMKISINGAGGIQLTMLSAISLNTFYDFALVWETATSLKLYRDGVLQSTTVVSNYQTTGMIYIGRRASALNLNGGIDEIRLFNDILTATEVLRLHNGI